MTGTSPSQLAVLALGGPTAAGKTDLAIALARDCDGEIVNADSRQIYLGMDIGTAKPTAAQRAQVAHHLLDIVRPADPFTLAQYVARAHAAVEAIAARGRLPILVGGTGLYLRAVLEGYQVPEVAPDPALRVALEREAQEQGAGVLLERLRRIDPVGAARIDGRNTRRVIRALEVTQTLGVPFSSLQRKMKRYRSLLLVLQAERSLLYARADRRLEAMVEAGFVDEVRDLLAAGYTADLPAFSALGYREVAGALLGSSSLAEALEATRGHTHDFIRRQLTWFRAERAAVPLSLERTDLARDAADLAGRWLAGDEPQPTVSVAHV